MGFNAHGHAPALELCRTLIEAGFDPATPLEVYRGDVLSLRFRTIAAGARLTVKTAGNGPPIFVLKSGSEGAAAPLVRKTRAGVAVVRRRGAR